MPDNPRPLLRLNTPLAPRPSLWSEYDIEATSALTDKVLRTLKYADAFAVLDSHGDIDTSNDTAEGLYFRDTRFLSRFEMRLEGKRPLLLSSATHENKTALSIESTNPNFRVHGMKIVKDSIFLHRTKFLLNGTFYERVSIRSYPTACAPQAWAAASVFGLLSATIGLELKQQEDEVHFRHPVLPDFLDEIVLDNLQLGSSCMSVRLYRYAQDVTANVLGRAGSSRIIIWK